MFSGWKKEISNPTKAIKLPPPEIRVGKISKKGNIKLEFNQELLVPDFID